MQVACLESSADSAKSAAAPAPGFRPTYQLLRPQGDGELAALARDIGLLQAAHALRHNATPKVQEAARELEAVLGA